MFKSYFQYPFDSILDKYPDALEYNLATHLVEKWERAIIAFYIPKANSKKEFIAIGSGFLVKTNGVHAIITANHVMEDLIKNDCYFSLNNSLFPLRKTMFQKSNSRDYAVIMPTEEIISYDKNFISFTTDLHQDLEPTTSMIISGFPSNKNNHNINNPHKPAKIYSILFNSFEYNTDHEDIYFYFDSRKKMIRPEMFEPLSSEKSLPSLAGMSGAPVMQIMINKNTSALTTRVIGVFKEHHRKKGKYLIASALSNFSEEITSLSN